MGAALSPLHDPPRLLIHVSHALPDPRPHPPCGLFLLGTTFLAAPLAKARRTSISFVSGNDCHSLMRCPMATHHPYADHDQTADQDYRDHVESYRAFLFGIRTSIAIAAVILALMAYFLLA